MGVVVVPCRGAGADFTDDDFLQSRRLALL